LVHIPGNPKSEEDLLVKLIFSVELEISSRT
jgi:hypothetical protein